MRSKYIRRCGLLMKLSHRELAYVYKSAGFPYCGKSNRRKLRMASKLVVYKYGPLLAKRKIERMVSDAVRFLVRTKQL